MRSPPDYFPLLFFLSVLTDLPLSGKSMNIIGRKYREHNENFDFHLITTSDSGFTKATLSMCHHTHTHRTLSEIIYSPSLNSFILVRNLSSVKKKSHYVSRKRKTELPCLTHSD